MLCDVLLPSALERHGFHGDRVRDDNGGVQPLPSLRGADATAACLVHELRPLLPDLPQTVLAQADLEDEFRFDGVLVSFIQLYLRGKCIK